MKNCKNCGAQFEVTDSDLKFYDKVSPVINSKKYTIPEPTFCPDCRRQRRFAFRNERSLYKVKSALSGDEILSCIHPEEGMKVLSQEEWWSDKWDPLESGKIYDFNKTFFEQFAELQKDVPAQAIHGMNKENSYYCNYAASCKNCYMIFGSIYSEDCIYGNPYGCKNCVDSLLVRDSEMCYECTLCKKCYRCLYCQDCSNSDYLVFCYDCNGCSECIGCVGLRNKKNHIFNKAYSKEEYLKIQKEFSLCDPQQVKILKDKFNDIKAKLPHRAVWSLNAEECTGDYIYESKNTKESYDVQRCWDCSYMAQTIDMKDCHDCNYMEENELCYEYIGLYKNNNILFSIGCNNSNEIFYSHHCMSSKNCFGCIGLRHKEFCILNKQYTEEEYNKLVSQIIEKMKQDGEYGEFFPVKISPFCYNETVAHEYFPLTKEESLGQGYRWREKDPLEYKKQTYIVPENIKDVKEDILNEILACENCGKNYRITAKEVQFYKKVELGIPKKCPNCRHKERLALRNSRKLWERKCDKCKEKILTTYAPDSPEIVYCEKCYLTGVF